MQPWRRMTDIDRFLRVLLRDANPEDTLAALQETIVSVLNTLPPSRQRDFARKLKRRIPEMLERANQLARERKAKSDADCCRHHSTRH
jgi:hypothetical protein